MIYCVKTKLETIERNKRDICIKELGDAATIFVCTKSQGIKVTRYLKKWKIKNESNMKLTISLSLHLKA